MRPNQFLVLVVVILSSINFLTAQTSAKSTATTVAKTAVSTAAKPTTSTAAKAVTTTTAKTVVKKKSTKSTSKKPSISGSSAKTTTATTTVSNTPKDPSNQTSQNFINTLPAKMIELQKPANTNTQTNTGTTPNNGQTTIQIKGGSDSNTNNGNQTKGGTTPNNTQPNQPQIKGGTDNNSNQNTNGGGLINTITDITQGDAASAIKEALMKGVTTGVAKVSVTDGYFGNSFIKIPFPQDVQVVESTMRSFGMGSMIDNLVLSLNRAAENAAVQAGPIFLNGIKQMTLNDAISIVSNKQTDAATQFLQRTTTESLVSAFKPSIQTALDKTLATKYWSDITGYYNKIPFVSPVNTNLPDYVTRKAITGLFYMVAQEEAKIRKDPINTGSDIINKVFGAFKK